MSLASNFKALPTLQEVLKSALELTAKADRMLKNAQDILNKLGGNVFKNACFVTLVDPVDTFLDVKARCDEAVAGFVGLQKMLGPEQFGKVLNAGEIRNRLGFLLGFDPANPPERADQRGVGFLELFWLAVIDELYTGNPAKTSSDPKKKRAFWTAAYGNSEEAVNRALQDLRVTQRNLQETRAFVDGARANLCNEAEKWRKSSKLIITAALKNLTQAQIFIFKALDEIGAERGTNGNPTVVADALWWQEEHEKNVQKAAAARAVKGGKQPTPDAYSAALCACASELIPFDAKQLGLTATKPPRDLVNALHRYWKAEKILIVLKDIGRVLNLAKTQELLMAGGFSCFPYWNKEVKVAKNGLGGVAAALSEIGKVQEALSPLRDALNDVCQIAVFASLPPNNREGLLSRRLHFFVPFEKLYGYALDPFHAEGGPKAWFFWMRAGYRRSDWGLLDARLRRAIDGANEDCTVKPYSGEPEKQLFLCRLTRHTGLVQIGGAITGRNLVSVWSFDKSVRLRGYAARASLLTAYVPTKNA
jgi:hypothetical protein